MGISILTKERRRFPAPQSLVAGSPTNMQVSVKDSKCYAASGGWGYGQFENGRVNQNAALVQKCFACHVKLNATDDLVFSHCRLDGAGASRSHSFYTEACVVTPFKVAQLQSSLWGSKNW
jgi:hypothetical protein